jgi:glycosyltransferase involved in cell wall biosynthesis
MKSKYIYLACPCNPIGGGMRRVADYLIQSQHFNNDDRMHPGLAELRALDTRGPGSAASSLFYLAGALWQILEGRISGRLVGVHVNMAERLSLFRKGSVVLFSRALGLPVVLHLHAAQLHHFYRDLPAPLQWLVRWTFAKATTVIVLGQASKAFVVDVLRVPAQRVTIVNNGVPEALVARRESSAYGKPLRLFFLGNLSERKGVSDLIRAIGLSEVASGGAFEAIFGGAGDISSYSKLATTAGAAGVCQFTGWLSQEQAATLMAGTDVLVLPSYDEGLPLVILEALANSTAVICTPVGEIPHVLTDGVDALFVQPGDITGLARAIDLVLSNAPMRRELQVNGRASYDKHFSIEKFADTIADFHQQHFGISARQSHTGIAMYTAPGVAMNGR